MKFYVKDGASLYRPATPDELLHAARSTLRRRYRRGKSIQHPRSAGPYLVGELGHLEYELFAVLWLDTRHRVIEFRPLFRGTVDGASVHPREVVRSAIRCNAAACVLAHNHPSGIPEPSSADHTITKRLKTALELIDVRVLDHLIVAADTYVSLAERGWQ